MTDEGAKKAILARRARFIAAAMLSAGLGARCEKSPPPEPCLSIAPDPDPRPSVCLSPLRTPPDDAGADAASGTDGGRTRPMVCLSYVRPPEPPPQPCLSPPRPLKPQAK